MMKEAVSAVFLILAVSQTSSQQDGCSPGWVSYGTSCYYVETNDTQKLTFMAANKWCKKWEGSFLTSVLRQSENDFLVQLISKINLRRNETFYIGLTTKIKDGTYEWEDGEPYNYTNWYNNSNRQELPNGNRQSCAYYNHLHQWKLDDGCTTKRLFICKQPKSISVACSPGWVLNGTSCYYVQANLTQKRNFSEAKKWCNESQGSLLTSVLSQRENNFLDGFINGTNLRPNETFYIGLRKLNNGSRLEWVDGVPYNYTNWYNNSNPELRYSEQQRCAYYNHLHQWQLDGCTTERLYICKQTHLMSVVKSTPSTTVSSVACSPGWFLNGTSCYYVQTNLTQKRSFWNAQKWCKDLNSSFLTSVLSQREDDFLDHLINGTNLRPNETFYIGLRTFDKGVRLGWVRGAPYNYTNWYNNSNPELGYSNQQRCAYYNHLHQWQLDGCTTERLFICKQTLPGSPPSKKTSSVKSTSKGNGQPTISTARVTLDEIVQELNNDLDKLEGASFNQSVAKEKMNKLGKALDSMLNSGSLSVDHISQVITTSERIGELMVKGLRKGQNITEPTSVQIQTGSLVLGVDVLPPIPSVNSSESVSFPEEGKQTGNINLPASLMWRAQQEDGVSISNLLISNVSVTADPQSSKVLNSGIISSTILFNNGSKFKNLSDPVVINLPSVMKANDDGSRICVFLDLTTDPPSWSPTGCVVHTFSSSHTVCHCNHMTSFAVLMDVHGAFEDDVISEEHELALSIISIVGCLIAFICYIALLFSFYFLRRRTETLCIHMNLAAAQSFAIFFFLVGFPGVRIRGVCYAFAVLLHYFQLASFCWMMVEGINLLRGMVKVFRVTSRMKIYSLFAWGLPVFVVAVTAALARDQYLRENFCWISHQVIWSFAGPVALILSVNLAVLIVAIKIVVRRAGYKETSTRSALELEIRAAFKTLVILVPLLGLTWILGYISIHSESLVFQYLFAVINSLQGLYFLIAQYCFDDDIKINARRASTRVKRMFTLSTSKSTSSLNLHLSNKKTAVSPQQKPADQDNNENNSNIPKQSSNDQPNNNEHSDNNQQSSLDQQNDVNAIPLQPQERTTDDTNKQVHPAQGKMEPEQNWMTKGRGTGKILRQRVMSF
ncbi:uncharacterized protein LOC144662705 isoform X2 [Oculina patagonica]